MNELEPLETELPEISEDYNNFFEWLRSPQRRLSFSSFKNFMEVTGGHPRKFRDNKETRKPPTPAMQQGTLEHCAVLEPDMLEERYTHTEKPDLRTKAGKEAAAIAEAAAEAQGKTLVWSPDYYAAVRLRKAIYEIPASAEVMAMVGETEKKLEWTFAGLNWHGYADMVGDEVLVDLKKVQDCTPRKVKYTLRDQGYLMQLALYDYALGGKRHRFVIAHDGMYSTVVRFSDADMKNALDDLKYYVTAFKRCEFLDQWHMAADFWSNTGFYEYQNL